MSYPPIDATTGYGIDGTGTNDSSAAVQTALDDGASQNRMVYFGNFRIKLSSGVHSSGPGFEFSECSYGSPGDPGFIVDGSGYGAGTGYAAVKISGSPTRIIGTIYGPTGSAMKTVNGVLLDNPILAQIQKLRVFYLDGWGVKINRCWDCNLVDISIEQCGNSSEYAFSMNDDGDTCNSTRVSRLQVEKAKHKAVYISDNTLGCVIDNVHSEQLTPNASLTAWSFGGASCVYNGIRLASNAPSTNAFAKFPGARNTYVGLRVEGGIDCEFEGWGGHPITVITPTIGTAHERTNQTGRLTFLGGDVGNWTGNQGNVTAFNTIGL